MMDTPATSSPPAFGPRTLNTLARLWTRPSLRATVLFLYYLGVIIALLLIYGRGDFTTAPFVYQGF